MRKDFYNPNQDADPGTVHGKTPIDVPPTIGAFWFATLAGFALLLLLF